MAAAPRPVPRRRRRDDGPVVRKNTIRLTADVARRVRLGHPWIYREAVTSRGLSFEPGAVIDVLDEEGDLLGRGLYDSDSAIAVRMFTRRSDRPVDGALIAERVRAAIALRGRYLDRAGLDAYRVINAEGDGLPGMVVERYGDYLVSQLYSSAVVPVRDALYDALMAELAPKAIYEQRRYKSLGGDAPRQAAAELVRGAVAPVEFTVREDDLTFTVDVTSPLSTGLFIDLRDGRRLVRRWARGRRVLNLFSYTGAISLAAKAGGATEVCAVDVAAKAHARSRRNLTASGHDPESIEHVVGDSLTVLTKFAERKRRFDLVVIDPPAFASAAARGGKPWSALRDYAELVTACLDVVEPGGLLCAVSSTHKIGPLEYEQALADGAASAGTRLQIIERGNLPVDFPQLPGFPEGNYLKLVVAARG